ncbi:hypothetical protein [Lutispora sp.]|uniref:hypothetical protein n=1 Tax=Lutispora sp. TaxID=2828727 RepID=UPI000EDD01EB|nr:hypothetical protein [Lutispora sp.]MEA4962418.1 hypothetical protein [Lutispora sp.]HCJ56735.1 hypothetical protein [Clostridiaceae bacterium]
MINIMKPLDLSSREASNGWYIMWEGAFAAIVFTLIAFIFHISWQMAWPLFFIYEVDFLHANEAWLSLINVSSALANVVIYSHEFFRIFQTCRSYAFLYKV